jgi:anaerobic magnesium-protoporphyrin IX monomethyl ester cyclase
VPEGRENVWVYTQPQTGDRLYSYDVDFTVTADYYKGDPNGGYRAFVFTDALSSTELVALRDEVERTTRAALSIPYNAARAAMRFEHSMGQGLPDFILRSSADHIGAAAMPVLAAE